MRLSVEGVRRVIGKYQNEIDAAKRYDEVAKELIGEEAVLNLKSAGALIHCFQSRDAL